MSHVPIPTEALKRFADDLRSDKNVMGKRFLEENLKRVDRFINKANEVEVSENVSESLEGVEKLADIVAKSEARREREDNNEPVSEAKKQAGQNKPGRSGFYDYSPIKEKKPTMLDLQDVAEFSTALGDRSRFGDGDGSYLDRWVNSDQYISNLREVQPKISSKGEVTAPLTGFKRHVKAVDDGQAQSKEDYTVVKSYTQRRAERLEREYLDKEKKNKVERAYGRYRHEGIKSESDAVVVGGGEDIFLHQQESGEDGGESASSSPSSSPTGAKSKSSTDNNNDNDNLPSLLLPELSLSREDSEVYFGSKAKAAFFDFYRQLMRMKLVSSNDINNLVEENDNADGTDTDTGNGKRSPRTNGGSSLPPVSARARENRNRLQEGKDKDGTNNNNPHKGVLLSRKSSELSVLVSLDSEGNLISNKSDKEKEEEEKRGKVESLRDVLRRDEEGKNKEQELQRVSDHLSFTPVTPEGNNSSNVAGRLRPTSARSRFIAACVEEEIGPRPRFMIRKGVSSSLNLRQQFMGDDLAVKLAEAMEFMPYLQHVDVAENNLGDVAIACLVSSFGRCPTLTSFDISNNKFGPRASEVLRDVLSDSDSHIRKLVVQSSELQDYHIQELMPGLSNNRLTSLDLSRNSLGRMQNLFNSPPKARRFDDRDGDEEDDDGEGGKETVRTVMTFKETVRTVMTYEQEQEQVESKSVGELLSSVVRHPGCRLDTLNLSWSSLHLSGMPLMEVRGGSVLYLYLYLYLYLSIYLFIYFTHLSIYPSIHLFYISIDLCTTISVLHQKRQRTQPRHLNFYLLILKSSNTQILKYSQILTHLPTPPPPPSISHLLHHPHITSISHYHIIGHATEQVHHPPRPILLWTRVCGCRVAGGISPIQSLSHET